MPEFLIFLIIGLFFGLVALNGLSTSWFIVKLASSLLNISLVHSLNWLSSGYCLFGTVFCFLCSYWIPISPLLALLYVFWPAIPLPFSFMQAWPLLILLPFLVKQLIKIIYALRLSSVNRFYKKYFPLNLIFSVFVYQRIDCYWVTLQLFWNLFLISSNQIALFATPQTNIWRTNQLPISICQVFFA